MIATLQEFYDSTALERRMLEWASTGSQSSKTPSRIDLRGSQNITVELNGVSTSDSARLDALIEFRPLLFGTAWKILDLLLEYALDGFVGPKQKRWTIELKKQHASSFNGSLVGLTEKQAIWQRLCLVYVATVEARHALVHRCLQVDAAGSFVNLVGESKTITSTEQEAMQGFALYCSKVALRQQVCKPRDELILAWYLNALASLHGQPQLPCSNEGVPPIVVVNAKQQGSRWVFDAQNVLMNAKTVCPTRSIFDVEIHLPGSSLPPVLGELEIAAQNGVSSFNLALVESWMTP